MKPSEWGLLIALSLVWGGSFFFNGILVTAWPPLTIVALRVGIAALVLHLVVLFRGEALALNRDTIGIIAVIAVLNNIIPFSLIVWGQTHIASGLASILNASTPLFTIVLAHLFTTDERLTRSKAAGVVIGFFGVVVLVGPEALSGIGMIFSWQLAGQMAVLGAGLSYAFASIYGRRIGQRGITPLTAATGQLTLSSLLLIPMAMIIDRPWQRPLPEGEIWAAGIGLAVLSTAIAYLVYFRLLASIGATNLVLVTFLVPVSAIILGVGILGEVLRPLHFLGMALIGLGLTAIDGRLVPPRRRRSRDGIETPPSG